MRKKILQIVISLLLFVSVADCAHGQAKKFRGAYLTTGGSTGSLDSLPVATFTDLDATFVETDGVSYRFSFDVSSTVAEDDPKFVRPNDNTFPNPGVHVLQSMGLNDLFVYGGIQIEGATNNAFEHIFAFVDPTADRTFTWPDDEVSLNDLMVGSGAGTFVYTAKSAINLSDFNDDLVHTTDTNLTQEEIEDFAGVFINDGTGTHTGIAVTYQDSTGDVDMVVDHDAATNFVAAEHIDWAGASAGTIHATNYTDNNTQLTDEEVQDKAGAMFTGNTETRVTVTYQDGDGTIDVVVDDMNDDVPDAGDFGNATDLDANGALNTGSVDANEIASTAVTPGSYTSTDITVDADGRITAASNGSGGTIDPNAIEEVMLKAVNSPTDEYVLTYEATTGDFEWEVDQTGAGGSAIVFDIGDDGGDDSADVNEIATTGDTNSIFTEPSADKILIAVGNNWPTADTANAVDALGAASVPYGSADVTGHDFTMGTAAGNDFTVNTSEFVVSGDTGFVGIGTGTPSVRLDVNGDSNLTGSFDVDSGVFYVDAVTNRVGIGTISPVGLLSVSSTGGAGNGFTILATADNSYAPIDFRTDEGLLGQFLASGSVFSGGSFASSEMALAAELATSGVHLAAIGANGWIRFTVGGNTSANERMRIDSSGNVGIGETSPAAMLDVYEDALFNSSGGDFDFNVGSVTEANALFVQGSDGNIGIGTGTPARELHINDGIVRVDRSQDTAAFMLHRTGLKTYFLGVNAAGVDDGSFFIGDMGAAVSGAASHRLDIDNDGNVGIGTESPLTDLSISGGTSSGEISILEPSGGGTSYASFKVPALAANTIYTLPPDDGDASEILQTDGAGVLTWVVDQTGAGGSAIVFDIGDDSGNDSSDVNEIATTGDTNSIFTESAADKILIAVGNNWPTADTANAVANGTIGLSAFDTDVTDMMALYRGAYLDSPSVVVSESGGTVTVTVERSGGGDLRMMFSDGITDWDTTPAKTVTSIGTLTLGSRASPQINYVYYLKSSGLIVASTTGWPSAEHAPLATMLLQGATDIGTNGPYKMHAWTDHTASSYIGHLADINCWIRSRPAGWESGVALTPSVGAGTFDISTSSGVVLQLHSHDYPAFNTATGSVMYIVNYNGANYTEAQNLTQTYIDTDANGVTLGGAATDYYNLVIWGVVNEATGDCKLMVNVPNGSYNNDSGGKASNDDEKTAIYDIPSDYAGTGFLIARLTVSESAGTYTIENQETLLGQFPGTVAGGGATGGNEFPDNVFRIQDDADTTKELAFQASGITTATTRTLTVQDADGIIYISGGTDIAIADGGTGASTLADLISTSEIVNDTILNSDINSAAAISISKTALVAGRSLTLTTDTVNADAELYTDVKTVYLRNSTGILATDDLETVWVAPFACTITKIHCESDQTVEFDFQIDDGTPADVNGTDIVCTTFATDASLAGDITMAAGDRLDLLIGAVSGTPTWFSASVEITFDD